MTTIQVKQPFTQVRLIENAQAKFVRFAFVEELEEGKWQCLMPYVLCRDYLKDMLYCKNITKEGLGPIYGFDTNKYEFAKIPSDALYLAIVVPKDLRDIIMDSLDQIHKIEDLWGAERTTVTEFSYKGSNSPHGLLFKADKRWMDSMLAISVYSFLIRGISWGDRINISQYQEDNRMWNCLDTLVKTCKSMNRLNKHGFLQELVCNNIQNIHDLGGLYYVHSRNVDQVPMYKEYLTVHG